MEPKAKCTYSKPVIEQVTLILEEGIVSGSARVYTRWETAGDEYVPKHTEWENSWNTNRDFDL